MFNCIGKQHERCSDGFRRLQEVAERKRLQVCDVSGDGHCAIYAIISQLKRSGVEMDVSMVRQKAVEYLREHPNVFEDNFLSKDEYADREDYLVKQAGDHWCDELMLRAISAVLQRTIYVLSDDGQETLLQGFQQSAGAIDFVNMGACSLRIGHIRERHYVSLQDIVDSHIRSSESADTSGVVSPAMGDSCVVNHSVHTDTIRHPSVWDTNQWLLWKAKNTWLICEDGKLGCSVCGDVQIKAEATQGVRCLMNGGVLALQQKANES